MLPLDLSTLFDLDMDYNTLSTGWFDEAALGDSSGMAGSSGTVGNSQAAGLFDTWLLSGA